MRYVLLLAAALANGQQTATVDPALAEIAATKRFVQTAISPDGASVIYTEALPAPNQSAIYIVPRIRITAGDGKSTCHEHAPAWSPDGKRIAFLSDCEKKDQLQLYVVSIGRGPARQLTHVKGLVAEPRWSPDGFRIATVSTENLPHIAGPLDPVPLASGVLESQIFEQRLTLVDAATGSVRQLSP